MSVTRKSTSRVRYLVLGVLIPLGLGLKALGLGQVVDIDGRYYYAAVNSGPVYNPCNLP